MQKNIDEIQKQVDELIRLCEGADAKDDASLHLEKFEKLGYLLLRLQDGDLDEKCLETLDDWLSSDKEAMRFYVEFQNLSSLLVSYFDRQREGRVLEKLKERMSVQNGG